jgi:aspartate aminotransferase-like enzyme
MDQLGIDVLVTGSQKALMLPPGLAFVALSPRAWAATEQAKLPRFYFDFKREKKGVAEKSTAWTPAISLINGLDVALDMMRAEGWDNLYARHDRCARATRAGVQALGLSLLAPESPSPAATAVNLPGERRRQRALQVPARQDAGDVRRAARTSSRARSSASRTWATSARST